MEADYLNIALKEWAVAVRAMEAGQQNVIFRKGGIQEPEGDFQLAHHEFLLYPAREHQKEQYVKTEFQPLLQETRNAQQGHLISIRSRARIIRYSLISSLAEATPYSGRHVWNDSFIRMRLDYKPDRPLYLIELQIEPLATPLEFVESTEQAGCKSWVNVDQTR